MRWHRFLAELHLMFTCCLFVVYLLFIATINSKKLPTASKSKTPNNRIDKPLFEIAEDYGEVDLPFETDRGCMRVHFSPQRVHCINHSVYCHRAVEIQPCFLSGKVARERSPSLAPSKTAWISRFSTSLCGSSF